jgi:hypothetical protein
MAVKPWRRWKAAWRDWLSPLFWAYQAYRLLALVSFGKTREQCVARRRQYANRRKALKALLLEREPLRKD